MDWTVCGLAGAGLWTRFLVDLGLAAGPSSITVLVAAAAVAPRSGRGPQMDHFRILRLCRLQERSAELGPAVFERGALIFQQRGIVEPASWAVSETRSSTS